MRKQQYIIGCLLFLCTALSVQAQRTLSGRVLGPDSVALKDATVLLYLANDSLPLRVATTDKRGEYTFQADTARYVMQVSLMGYAPYEREFIFSSQSKTVRLDDVILREAVRQLGEVEIQGEQDRTTVKLEDDKEVYTLSSRVKRNAASAYMALADVPGLEVDMINDKISVRGSDGGTQTMVNGIPRSKGYVQTIDPKTIDKVEVIRFPSMRYSSRGIGGLVNIVTKEPVRGYSGYGALKQDPLLRYGWQGLGFNGVHEKLAYSLYASNYYFDEDERDGYTLRKIKQGDYWNQVERKSYDDGKYNTFSPNVGANIDYTYSAHSFSSLSVSYSYTDNGTDMLYQIKEATVTGKRTYFASEHNGGIYRNASAGLYHQTKWKDIHTLSIDANYGYGNSDGGSDYREMDLLGDVPFKQTQQSYDVITMKADLQANMEHKWKNVTLGEGYRFSWNQNDNFRWLNRDVSNLVYDEWRNNLYVDLSGRFHPKWFYRAGATLDVAKTKILGRSNVYTDVMPAATLRYNLSPKQFLSLDYKRSRQVPGMSMLNPEPETVDSVRVYHGNPNLRPVYSNSVTLGVYSYVKKLYLYLTLGYRWGDAFSSLSKVNDKGINVITYGRASEWRAPRVSLDIAWFMTKWLKIGVYSTVGYSMYKDANEEQFNRNLWRTSVRPYGTITGKRLYGSFSFPITIKQKTFTGYTRDVIESNLNMSYRLNNSWNLLLECRYFEPLSYRGETDIDGFYEYYRHSRISPWQYNHVIQRLWTL